MLIEEAKPGRLGWAGPAYEFGLASLAAAGRTLASIVLTWIRTRTCPTC